MVSRIKNGENYLIFLLEILDKDILFIKLSKEE
jgi:hypothetical protein